MLDSKQEVTKGVFFLVKTEEKLTGVYSLLKAQYSSKIDIFYPRKF